MFLEREKLVLLIGGTAAALLLLITFVVSPAISRMQTISRTTTAAEKNLSEMRRYGPELQRVRQATLERQNAVGTSANSKESPLTQLTAMLQGAGIPAAAASIKSSGIRDGDIFREETFEIQVENVTYLEAVNALRKLSAKDLPVVVRAAVLKSRYDDHRYLDMTLRVGYLSPKTT